MRLRGPVTCPRHRIDRLLADERAEVALTPRGFGDLLDIGRSALPVGVVLLQQRRDGVMAGLHQIRHGGLGIDDAEQ